MSDDLDVHVLRRDINANTKDIGKLKQVVLGNGERGMDEVSRSTEVAVLNLQAAFEAYKTEQENKESLRLEAQIKEAKEKEERLEKEKKDRKNQIMLMVLGILFTGIFNLVIAGLAWWLKIYPVLESLK